MLWKAEDRPVLLQALTLGATPLAGFENNILIFSKWQHIISFMTGSQFHQVSTWGFRLVGHFS